MRLLSAGIGIFLFSHTLSAAEQPIVQPSLNGYGGYFNVPSAYNLPEGYGSVIKSSLTEREGQYIETPNFQFGVSLWKNVELSARNSAYTPDTNDSSDLSANIKVQVPFIPENWFKLAIGIQDLGGAANHYDSKFVVASKYFSDWNLDVSLGTGKSDSRLDRIDGTFAAIKWQPYEWVAALAEYDATSTNYGIELSTPREWLGGTQIISKAMLGASDERLADETFYSVGLSVSLAKQAREITPAELTEVVEVREPQSSLQQHLSMLNKALVRRGFDEFKVGLATPEHLVIEVDNSVYSTNFVDTYGVVLGIASQYSPEQITDFTVRIKQTGIVIDSISGNMAQYRAFLKGDELKLARHSDKTIGAVEWFESESSFLLKPRVTLYPHLVSTVGTEWGMFDYSLALATNVELPLWTGSAITAFHQTHLTESRDFRRDTGYFRRLRQPDSELTNVTFHQAFKLPYNSKVLFNYGQYQSDFTQASIEMDWLSDNGKHWASFYYGDYQFDGEARYGYDKSCLNDPDKILVECYQKIVDDIDRKVKVAKYRYYSSGLDTSFLFKYGQYWSGDKGLHFLASRHYGDFQVNFSVKATKGALEGLSALAYEDDYQKQVGIGFTVPLGPRKDFNTRYINIRGRADWSYVLHTLVGEKHNGLTFGLADEARNFYNLGNHFNNFDRNGLSYIYQNQDRLRQAYFDLR